MLIPIVENSITYFIQRYNESWLENRERHMICKGREGEREREQETEKGAGDRDINSTIENKK